MYDFQATARIFKLNCNVNSQKYEKYIN